MGFYLCTPQSLYVKERNCENSVIVCIKNGTVKTTYLVWQDKGHQCTPQSLLPSHNLSWQMHRGQHLCGQCYCTTNLFSHINDYLKNNTNMLAGKWWYLAATSINVRSDSCWSICSSKASKYFLGSTPKGAIGRPWKTRSRAFTVSRVYFAVSVSCCVLQGTPTV